MTNSIQVLNFLEKHFETKGWPTGVHLEKFRDRARLGADDAYPGWDVVEIERHRSALGAVYQPGCAMSALATYYMRYAVHKTNFEVKELPERRGTPVIDIHSLVEEHLGRESFRLTIEAIDQDHFEIGEGVSGEKAVITTLEEAKEFSASLEDNFSYFFQNPWLARLATNPP